MNAGSPDYYGLVEVSKDEFYRAMSSRDYQHDAYSNIILCRVYGDVWGAKSDGEPTHYWLRRDLTRPTYPDLIPEGNR